MAFSSRNSSSPATPHSRRCPTFYSLQSNPQSAPCTVDVYVACSNLPGHAARAFDASGCHETRQPVGSVIRNSDRIAFVLIRDDERTGPKISSRAMVMSLRTSANTVGFTK